MKIYDAPKALNDIREAFLKNLHGYIERPGKVFEKALRITIPIKDKPNHYLALTLTGVEFIKLDESN